MDIRQLCFYGLLILLCSSTGYLTYLAITTHLPLLYRLRFLNFILEHVLGIVMLVKRKLFCNEEDTCGHLMWMIGFTGVNFINFVAVEIYGMVNTKSGADSRLQSMDISFIVLSYFHLYYQINIYLGVFCLFSIAMGIVYFFNQRRHAREMEEVLEDLKSEKYQENEREPSCSICLSDFQKSESVYKLVCGHTFHKDCLKDWFKQKLTCPMCRDDVARGRHGRENHYEEYQDSEIEEWHRQNMQQYHTQQQGPPLNIQWPQQPPHPMPPAMNIHEHYGRNPYVH